MTEFDTERQMLLEQHGDEISDLQDIMFAMEQNFNERENDARSEFQSMRDEIKNKVKSKLLAEFLFTYPISFCFYKVESSKFQVKF